MENDFVSILTKIVKKVASAFSTLGSLFLLLMMFVLVAEVCLRAMGSGVLGSYEIVELSMVPLIFLSFANVQAQKRNVEMDLMYNLLPKKILPFIDVLILACMLTLTVFMVAAAGVQALYEYDIYNVSAVLYLPKYPFMGLEMLGFLLLIIVLIVDLLNWFVKMKNGSGINTKTNLL